MVWNHQKTVAMCTGTLVLFSPVSGVHTRFLSPAETAEMAAVINSPHAAAVHASRRRSEARYTVYLSFDDGPSEGSKMVNELSTAENVPINVFLIGRNACLTPRNRELLQEYRANPLVELGNHSFSHAWRQYHTYFKEPATVLADFRRNSDSLQLTNGLCRLPGRNFFRLDSLTRNDHSNGKEAADLLSQNGYKVYGWDLEWRRRPAPGIGLHNGVEMMAIVSRMLDEKKTFMPGKLVLLLHDTELRDENFKAELVAFIQLVQADSRYQFGHLSEYAMDEGNQSGQ